MVRDFLFLVRHLEKTSALSVNIYSALTADKQGPNFIGAQQTGVRAETRLHLSSSCCRKMEIG